MKKLLLLISIFTISFLTKAQQVDTIFICDAYQSHYSFEYKNPLMVVYKLYNGGGDCDRSKYHFNNNGLGDKTATSKDYYKSGYEKGHLANAEDFAYDCKLDSMTFKYWNCLPQTLQLNRGVWKINEGDVRDLSKTDTLLILCGGVYSDKIIGNSVYVPDSCWKIVYSYNEKKIIMCKIFTNTDAPLVGDMEEKRLINILKKKYNININKIIK